MNEKTSLAWILLIALICLPLLKTFIDSKYRSSGRKPNRPILIALFIMALILGAIFGR